MKITKLKLKQLIREALDDVLHEAEPEAGEPSPQDIGAAALTFLSEYCMRGGTLKKAACAQKYMEANGQFAAMRDNGTEPTEKNAIKVLKVLTKLNKYWESDPKMWAEWVEKGRKTTVQERRRRR